MIPQLKTKYVDTGKARLVSREFPLTSIHPLAEKAAEAAVCAGRQSKYWEMHDKLFASQSEWTATGADNIALFKQYAQGLGLSTTTFNQCLDNGEAALEVQGDTLAGNSLGVQGTPSFFVNDQPYPFQASSDINSLSLVIDYVAAGGTIPSIVPEEGDFHMQGNTSTAQAAMAAFLDYTSADSANFMLNIFPTVKTTYIDPGKLIYIFHPLAGEAGTPGFQAALSAECSGEQGKFVEMQTQIFKDQKTWTTSATPATTFAGYAQALGLDTAKFQTCLSSDSEKLRVQGGAVVALLYGATSAQPFLFSNGQSLASTATLDQFKTTIDSMVGQ